MRRSSFFPSTGLGRSKPVVLTLPLRAIVPSQRTTAVNPAMPTTIDRFIASYQLCQQIADMQNNMRANVQIIQAAKNAGTIPTFAAAQQAFRDLGTAFLSRIAVLTTLVTNNLAAVQAGTLALGITWADITTMKDLLTTWATNLSTATITTQAQMDNSVAALLAAVPAAMQPY